MYHSIKKTICKNKHRTLTPKKLSMCHVGCTRQRATGMYLSIKKTIYKNKHRSLTPKRLSMCLVGFTRQRPSYGTQAV
jgi:hypothetical protein